MNTIDRVLGICMVIIGIGLFIIAHLLVPYMDTLSETELHVVAASTAIAISVPITVFVVFGALQAAGLVIIKVEGGKQWQ
jgi:type IV secretory pathway TrbL component